MRFRFTSRDSLPRLAWWARVERGNDTVEVRHGPWVETREDWFAEGAWDGPVSREGFAGATCFTGTGARLDGDAVRFCGPTSMLDRLVSVRVGDAVYVSNSLPCLLAVTNDRPDPAYPYYFGDMVDALRVGVRFPDKSLRMHSGRRVALHDYGDVIVACDLTARREEKHSPEAPRDFEHFAALLRGMILSVSSNATDPTRRAARFRPLGTVSRGYDADAIAVYLREAGTDEAIAMVDSAVPDGDDGTTIGEQLGYRVTRYDRWAFRAMTSVPEPEFCACPPGIDVVLAACGPQLEGSLLATGRHGDVLLSMDPSVTLPDMLEPAARYLGGSTMTEFRLRVGFLQFAPLYGFAIHAPKIGDISRSAKMRPWSVGGDYDRPIARRIVETAGVARGEFGVTKHATANAWPMGFREMSPGGAADFQSFLNTLPPIPASLRFKAAALGAAGKVLTNASRLHWRLNELLGTPGLDRYRKPLTESALAFHWGCDRVRARYIER